MKYNKLISIFNRYRNTLIFSWLPYLVGLVYLFSIWKLLSYKLDGNLLFASLFFIAIARFKAVFISALIYSSVLATVFSPCLIYGPISSDFFLQLLIADTQDVKEFIEFLPAELFILIGILWASTIYLIKFRSQLALNYKPSQAKPSQASTIILIIIAVYVVFYSPFRTYSANVLKNKEEKFEFSNIIYKNTNFIFRATINIWFEYQRALRELTRQADIMDTRSDWNPQRVDSEFDVYVVVIGESARRDALHAYGFSIENTPFLSNTPRIQFNSYISAGGNTTSSLSNMFIPDFYDHGSTANNIVDLAKLAGFKTYWLSDQSGAGKFDSLVSGIGKRADYAHFINRANTKNRSYDDHLLLPHIAAALEDESAATQVIFVHLYGSHMPFCRRTDNDYDVFFVSRNISCYVQSIKQTDDLLDKIYTLLQQNKQHHNKEWAMVYFSDHGLTPGNMVKSLYHHFQYQENYEVPFVIFNSKLTDTTWINSPRSGLDFVPFFAQWAGIKDNRIPETCHFLSEESCPNGITTINYNNNTVVNYLHLKNERVHFFR